MDRCTSLVKALDLVTLLASRDSEMNLAQLSEAMNLPRSTVVRIVNTLKEYGLLEKTGRQYRCGPTFDNWARRSNHSYHIDRYKPALKQIAEETGELTLLGVQIGNGVAHIHYIESDQRIRVAPAPDTLHNLRYNALGKLALAKRPDLAEKWTRGSPTFAKELDTTRKKGFAWNREESASGMIALAAYGFTDSPTEPMIAVSWPTFRFTETKGKKALRSIKRALSTAQR